MLTKHYLIQIAKDCVLSVNINIGCTLGLWLKHKEPVSLTTYVDGDASISVRDSLPICIATEQNIGDFMDFLSAPRDFVKNRTGLLAEGIHCGEVHTFAKFKSLSEKSVFTIEVSNLDRQISLEISPSLCKAFDDLRDHILRDLDLMFAEKNIELISNICEIS